MPSVQYPQSSVQSRPATIPAGRKKNCSVSSAQCPQSSTLSPVPSVQCPQSSALSPASGAVLPPYLQGERKTAQCPLPSALSPVPSAQCPQSSTLSPASRAVPPPYLQGEKKTASTGKNSKEKRAELRPEKKSKQPGSWPGAPPHLGGKKIFLKVGWDPEPTNPDC